MFRAITQRRQYCNERAPPPGGPEAVREMLARNRILGIRFGPGERLMQSQIAGLQWQPGYSVGRTFYTARSSVPAERRRAAFERYIDDPIDGATPAGLVDGLSRLRRGELLSRASTERLLVDHVADPDRREPAAAAASPPAGGSRHKTGTGGARRHPGRLITTSGV